VKKYFCLPINLFFDKRLDLSNIKITIGITIGDLKEGLMEKKGGEKFEGY